MPTRIDTNAVDALTAILTRLKSAMVSDPDNPNSATLGDRQCYAVARPEDVTSVPPGGNYFLTVALGGGTFNDAEQIPQNCTEDGEFTVSIYTKIKTDSAGHDGYLLTEASRGLLPIKRLVLKALVGKDLQNANDYLFLREWIKALRSTPPDIVKAPNDDLPLGRLQITFALRFDWDLTN